MSCFLWFLCKSDLRISCLYETTQKLSEINRDKNQGNSHKLEHIKGSFVNRAVPSLHGGINLRINLTEAKFKEFDLRIKFKTRINYG